MGNTYRKFALPFAPEILAEGTLCYGYMRLPGLGIMVPAWRRISTVVSRSSSEWRCSFDRSRSGNGIPHIC